MDVEERMKTITTDEDDPLEIPQWLRVPQAERDAAWARRPPRLPQAEPDARLEEIRATEERLREERKRRDGIRRKARKARERSRAVDLSRSRWDATRNRWVDVTEERARRVMAILSEMSGPELVRYYNEMAEKIGEKKVGSRSFKTKAVAVARCSKIEEAVRMREAGVVVPVAVEVSPTDGGASDVASEATTKESDVTTTTKKRTTTKRSSAKPVAKKRTGTLKEKLIALLMDNGPISLRAASRRLYGEENLGAIGAVMRGIRAAIKSGDVKAKWAETKEDDRSGETLYKLVAVR